MAGESNFLTGIVISDPAMNLMQLADVRSALWRRQWESDRLPGHVAKVEKVISDLPRNLANRRRWRRDLRLPHSDRVDAWGHRAYVGGTDPEAWYGIGKRQFHFLVANGLEHHHRFLDVACGSLRLGQFVIPMLDKGCYFGLEAEKSLVDAGLAHEMLSGIADIRQPSFAFNTDFNIDFVPEFDVAIAQSLFTHMTIDDILSCFSALRGRSHSGSRFFSTFFEGDPDVNPDGPSHANRDWYYGFETFETIGRESGWNVEYIGDWGHERGQMMTVATPV